MRQKKIVLISSLICLFLGGGVIMGMSHNKFSLNGIFHSARDRQLAYVKEHEEEIVKWIRSKYPKIESIQFDWNTLRVGSISNGIFTTGYNLSVKGTFNYIPETIIYIDFILDESDSIPSMDRITMNQPPRISKQGILDIYE